MSYWNKIIISISNSFGIGKLTSFPGTLGSFIILVPMWFLKINFSLNQVIIFILIFSIFSYFIIHFAIKILNEKDPKNIILDEYIGQAIAVLFCNEKISHYLIIFLLFRIFDIFKPFPINYLDKIDNSFGIIIDDVFAGLLSGVIFFLFFKELIP